MNGALGWAAERRVSDGRTVNGLLALAMLGVSAGCDGAAGAPGEPGSAPIVAPAVAGPATPSGRPPALSPMAPGAVVPPAWNERRRQAEGEGVGREAPTVPGPVNHCVDPEGTWLCGDGARCLERAGVWECQCAKGFEGDGFSCVDVDECAAGTDDCEGDALCVNVQGGFTCRCPQGFEDLGAGCVDVDECAAGQVDCGVGGACVNTVGAFACECADGFALGESGCVAVAPCDLDPCAAGASCVPAEGAFACACPDGTTGDGVSFCAAWAAPEVRIGNGSPVVTSTLVQLRLQEPGNLLANGGAEEGTHAAWTVLDGAASDIAALGGGFLGGWRFVGGPEWVRRGQLVDLLEAGLSEEALDAAPPITAREWAIGTWPQYGDERYLRVELRDASGAVVASWEHGSVGAPVVTGASWAASEATLADYGPGVRYVWFEDGVRGAEPFAGAHGAALDAASVVVGATRMRVSNDGATWTDWLDFQPMVSWELEPGPGDKTVFVELQDAWGTIHAASATVLLQ